MAGKKSKTKENKEAMVEALRRTLGNVTAACKIVGVTRDTHYRWLETDANYADAVDDVTEQTFDFVENKLMDKVKDGDLTAIIFYCKTRMKGRGYTERQEMEIDGDLVIDVSES